MIFRPFSQQTMIGYLYVIWEQDQLFRKTIFLCAKISLSVLAARWPIFNECNLTKARLKQNTKSWKNGVSGKTNKKSKCLQTTYFK